MQSRRHPQNPTKRAARILGGLACLFVAILLAVWWRLAGDDPSITIPNPVMPSPNAFDYYVAAGHGLVNAKQIDNINSLQPTYFMPFDMKVAAVEQNAAVIRSLHQGFAYEYRNPPVRSNNTLYPQLSGFRGIARLLAAQSQVRGIQRDWGGAAESALDAIRLGEDIPRGGGVLVQLTGISCAAIGRRPLWNIVEHLNAAQSHAAIARLTNIMERHFSYADTLQEEKWIGQASFKEIFRSIKPRTALATADGFTAVSPSAPRYLIAFDLLYGKKRILQNYTALMDVMATQARQPYGLHLPPPVASDPINQVITPIFADMRLGEVKAQAQNGFLLTALALHAYRLEYGRYPASLAELTPACLKRLPEDPFALQGTFKYRLDGKSYVLYSVGPDGKDDGGTPIDDPKQAGSFNRNARYLVDKESVGDIVAGKNQW